MSDVLLVVESSHAKYEYFRIDFILDAAQRSGFRTTLYACGPVEGYSGGAIGLRIEESRLLRLLNFLAYLITFRSLTHLGYLVSLWPLITEERPKLVVFYSFWTGLFLLFWKEVVGSNARLVRDWYDLDTRMRYFGRRRSVVGRFLIYLEEIFAPTRFDGLIVPTQFALRLLEDWGHSSDKIHVLGELRGLNPYVNSNIVEKRISDMKDGGPVEVVWIGAIRDYQQSGLISFLRALSHSQPPLLMSIHIAGPSEAGTEKLLVSDSEVSSRISLAWHGPLSRKGIDQLLASSHMAIHPLPQELFCDYVFSRKLADYFASALPVLFSSVKGIQETAETFGVGFDFDIPESLTEATGSLLNPEHYAKLSRAAWRLAHQEYSSAALQAKGDTLVRFLRDKVDRTLEFH